MRLRTVLLVATLALMCLPAIGRASNLVVVAARGIDLKPGAQIDGAKPLSLSSGQMVTLISSTGRIIKLRGPMNAPPAPGQSGSSVDVKAALRTMVTQNVGGSTELGVVRGARNEPVPPAPWLIDVTHDGNRCVPANHPIEFWRPGGGGTTTITIEPYDRSWSAQTEWQANTDVLTVPRTVPLRSRTTYFVKLGKKETAVTLILIPSTVDNDAMRAAWMLEAGCAPQVKALLEAAR